MESFKDFSPKCSNDDFGLALTFLMARSNLLSRPGFHTGRVYGLVWQFQTIRFIQMMFDLWPVYSGERFRASWPSCLLTCRYRAISTTVGPLPGNLLATRMANLTPDLQGSLSWGSIAENFHYLQSLSVSCFQVILVLPGPRFPSTCMSKAVLSAPLECSTCPYQRSLLSFSMRSRSSVPSRASSSVDLMVAVSFDLTVQICLNFAVSFRSRHWRLGFVNGQVSLAWSIALHTHALYTWPGVLRERWWEERTGEFLPDGFHTCCGWKLTTTGCWEHVSQVAKGSYHLQLVRPYLHVSMWSVV